jgi:threonine synthase
MGEKIYLVVPSGNFGNALGAYYAKKAGLPIQKILIASNINNILTDWINTGVYDLTDRTLILTESPAMDILKSSNIERVMYDKFGGERTKELMDDLTRDGKYQLSSDELASLQEDFTATFSDDEEGETVIATYAQKGYIMDPHTATCMKAYETLREEKLPTVIYSTAEWTKFSSTVSKALGHPVKDDIEALKWVTENANVSVPSMINDLFDKPIMHTVVVDKESIKGEMLNFL